MLTLAQRFHRHVERTFEKDGCWIWKGAMGGSCPTPVLWIPHSSRSARRISLQLAGRKVNRRHVVRPDVCGRVRCVKPEHLVAGPRRTPWRIDHA